MASFHKLTVIGKLVGDPKINTFANGGKVAKIGLPINFTQRKKNAETGQWEGDSFIIDVDVFNRQNGAQLADLVEQYLRKGNQVYVEGRLKPNSYTDKNGVKTFKPVLVADTIQFLDSRDGVGGADEPTMAPARPPRLNPQPSSPPARKPAAAPAYSDEPMEAEPEFDNRGPSGDDIPF
jgi:single-strand DNA-binding protein